MEELIVAETMPAPLRIYRTGAASRRAPVVLHLHGGAFIGGSLDAGRIVSTLLADAGAIVVSADYPLAPQHRFPDALQAAFATLKWLHEKRAQWAGRKSGIFVAGEEAGGNLAAGLAMMARDQHAPLAGQILLSPMLDPCMGTCSIRQAAAGAAGGKWADGWHQYLGCADNAEHPYATPLGSRRLAGLAPALVITAEDDLLRDETLSYARRLRESGVAVTKHVLPAPTGWPSALGGLCGVDDAVQQPWARAVRDCFAEFFADNAVVPVSSSHPSLERPRS